MQNPYGTPRVPVHPFPGASEWHHGAAALVHTGGGQTPLSYAWAVAVDAGEGSPQGPAATPPAPKAITAHATFIVLVPGEAEGVVESAASVGTPSGTSAAALAKSLCSGDAGALFKPFESQLRAALTGSTATTA